MIVKNIEILSNSKTVLGSMPDIDTDFPGRRRDEIKTYMEERFGKEQVCSLGTYTTFQLKEAISDMARADGIPVQLYRWFTACIGDDNEKTIEEFFKTVCGREELKKFVKEHTETFNDMMVILGAPKSQSVHACGTVVLPDNKSSYEWMPVHAQKGLVVTDWEGSEVEEAGFLKEDILGIIQLDKFEEMLRLIKENHGIDIDIYSLPLNDKQVFDYAGKGWLGDVFQLGSPGLSGYCVKMKPDNINELSACVALYRPGAMENNFHNEYILRKNSEKDWEKEMPIGAEDILSKNFGIILYQEDVMLMCQKLAGFDLEETDSVRKALGKKIMEKMKMYGNKFVKGYVNNYGNKGVTEESARVLWKQMEEFAKYSFNKCLTGDEKIYPNDMPIKELYEKGIEDIPAITMDKYGNFISTKVKEIRYAGKRFIYKIQTSDGAEVRCSGNHKFPTPEGRKYAFLLRKGDVLYAYKHEMRVNVEIVYINIEDVQPTYDVEIDHPEHNFVTGNGIVTCNSHSVCYGMTAYICLWLKVHYPIEYWSATFSFAKDEKIPYYVNEIQQSGEIKIHPVDINKSDVNIVSDYRTNSMYWAFNAVKQCGEKAQEFISEEKKKNGPFFSLEEFIDRCVQKGSPVNKSVIENLIFAGAFDELENIEDPTERLRLIESYRENKRVKILEDKDLLTNIMKVRKEKNSWWWLLQQKRTSGFAFFDYYNLVSDYHLSKLDDETEFQDVSQIKFWDNGSKKTRRAAIGGYVIEIVERKSKKGIFANLIVESNYEFITVTVFPELFEEYGEFLRGSKKNLLLVNGVIVWDKFKGEYILQTNINSLFTILT